MPGESNWLTLGATALALPIRITLVEFQFSHSSIFTGKLGNVQDNFAILVQPDSAHSLFRVLRHKQIEPRREKCRFHTLSSDYLYSENTHCQTGRDCAGMKPAQSFWLGLNASRAAYPIWFRYQNGLLRNRHPVAIVYLYYQHHSITSSPGRFLH